MIENRFHIALYAAAIMTCLTVLAYTYIQKRTDRRQNKVFLVIVSILILNAVTSVGSSVSIAFIFESDSAKTSLLIFQNLYFLLHTALCPVFYAYVLCVTERIRMRSRFKTVILSAPLVLTELLCILNPIFHSVFYYDSDFAFHRNWGVYLIYIAAAFYFLHAMVTLFRSWNALTSRRKLALLYFFALSIAGILIQLINIDIKSELFAESLAIMGLMLAVENEEDRVNPDIGIYNRRALRIDLDNYMIRKEKVDLIIIKVIDEERLARATGSSNSEDRDIAITSYLRTVVPWYRIYQPTDSCFVVYSGAADKAPVDDMTARIKERFEESWIIGKNEFMIDTIVFNACVPDDLSGVDEVLYATDSIIPPSVNKNSADILYLTRRSEIERVLRRNLENEAFEVYYQPTYSSDGKTLHGAEALVRMKPDAKLGYISPEEFIPIAEQIGIVREIDDYVLNSVCEFLSSEIPSKLGMECININLSIIQCLRPGFTDHLIETVNNYSIDHSMLNFEITETVDAGDYEILTRVVSDLKKSGFILSMDDYGTGYSNVGAIFSLDFDIVKIDKSILWNSENDDHGRIILEDTIRMISDLGLKILVEGVETDSQMQKLQSLNVDYFQGYYFSRPVPKDVLLEKLTPA